MTLMRAACLLLSIPVWVDCLAVRPIPGREPVGVETIFARAKSMRSSLVPRKPRWHKRLRLRRRRKAEVSLRDMLEKQESLDVWGVQKAKETISVPFELDPSEADRLAAMKVLVEADLAKVDTRVRESYPDVYGDLRLLRFLRKDEVQDPVSAALRYRSFLQWRQDSGADIVRSRIEKDPFYIHSTLTASHIPCDFALCCDDRSIVSVVMNVGDWDTASVSRLIQEGALSLEDFLTHWTVMFESLHMRLHELSVDRCSLVYIDEVCDMSRMSLHQFSPSFVSNILKPWIHLTQTYYPETAERICLVNPPRILSLVWGLVASLASPRTVAKVKLYHRVRKPIYKFARHHEA